MAARRPGFTLLEALVSVSLVGMVSGAIFLLFYTGETSLIGGQDEGAAVAEAQSALRAIAADVRRSGAFGAPEHGGLCLLREEGHEVEYYQEGRVLKRVERVGAVEPGGAGGRGRGAAGAPGSGPAGRGIGWAWGRGRSEDASERPPVGVTGVTEVASGLAASGGFSLRFLGASMAPIPTLQGSGDYRKAVAVEVTVVVPWRRDTLGQVRRTTCLALRNREEE